VLFNKERLGVADVVRLGVRVTVTMTMNNNNDNYNNDDDNNSITTSN
jgi:hypothetical protein